MGLPAQLTIQFTEPQADEAFQWGGSKTEPQADGGFATLPLGLADERDDIITDSFDFVATETPDAWSGGSIETGGADGLAMEGVGVGIIAGSSTLTMEPLEEGIAAPNDQDVLTGVEDFMF